MEFREQLVSIRRQKGWSQEQLAERIGVSRQAISKWETGDSQPALAQLIVLADELDISLDVLCGRTTEAAAAPAAGEAAVNAASAVGASSTGEAAPPSGQTFWKRLCLILCLISAVLLSPLALMALHVLPSDVVPAEEAAAVSALPDTIQVTGLSFSAEKLDRLSFQFVPSIIDDALIYTLTFTASNGQSRRFEVTGDGGVFAGTVDLFERDTYTVALEITAGEERRAVALARDLTFGDHNASWLPLS